MLPKLNGRLLRSALLTICVLTLLPCALRAQNATGSLLGEVQDASGARIKSANVVVTDPGPVVGDHHVGGFNACSTGILHFAEQRAGCILRSQREGKQSENTDCQQSASE